MIDSIALVLSIIPYSESSIVIKALTWDRAQISILAKGWRKKADPLLRFWEYEFTLYEPKEDGLYLLKEANALQDFSSYPNAATWAAAECGAELLLKIIIPSSEATHYYTLLREYLLYLRKVESNGILIFWRLLQRIFKMMGIGMRIEHCAICNSTADPVAMNAVGELICAQCFQSLPPENHYQSLRPMSQKVLILLPEIGKHLKTLKLNREDIAELNQLFLAYYSAHQRQTLKLKSLSVLSQFY